MCVRARACVRACVCVCVCPLAGGDVTAVSAGLADLLGDDPVDRDGGLRGHELVLREGRGRQLVRGREGG